MPAPAPEIFKAYDIRGIVRSSLTADVVRQIGLALGTEAVTRGIDANGELRPTQAEAPANAHTRYLQRGAERSVFYDAMDDSVDGGARATAWAREAPSTSPGAIDVSSPGPRGVACTSPLARL